MTNWLQTLLRSLALYPPEVDTAPGDLLQRVVQTNEATRVMLLAQLAETQALARTPTHRAPRD